VPEYLSGLTVFLLIGAAGLVFLLASLVVGDLFDHFDADAGFDASPEGPGFLDSRVISVFLLSFGGFGAMGTQMGLGPGASSLLGVGGGVVLAGAVSLFGRFLYNQQASSVVSAGQLVGRTAQVSIGIQPGSVGQVLCRVGEERVEKLARSRNNEEIKAGTLVRIEEIAGDSVIVSPEDGARKMMNYE
jgi:membrane protein implicated in regulation of membrane protease activity